MGSILKILILATAFFQSITIASAVPAVQDVVATGQGLKPNSFDYDFHVYVSGPLGEPSLQGVDLYISETFASIHPIALAVTVSYVPIHSDDYPTLGDTDGFTVDASIGNLTGSPLAGMNFQIITPDNIPGGSIKFGYESPPSQQLLLHFDPSSTNEVHTRFLLVMPHIADDGPYTFTLLQTPVIPEPETYGMFLAGLGLMGVMARRKTKPAHQ